MIWYKMDYLFLYMITFFIIPKVHYRMLSYIEIDTIYRMKIWSENAYMKFVLYDFDKGARHNTNLYRYILSYTPINVNQIVFYYMLSCNMSKTWYYVCFFVGFTDIQKCTSTQIIMCYFNIKSTTAWMIGLDLSSNGWIQLHDMFLKSKHRI